MMQTDRYENVLRQANTLSAQQRLLLAESLLRTLEDVVNPRKKSRKTADRAAGLFSVSGEVVPNDEDIEKMLEERTNRYL